MKSTSEELQQIRKELLGERNDRNLRLIYLLDTELKRRNRGGRPKVDKDLLERNREAAKRYREKLKLKVAMKAKREKRRIQKHDKLMQKAGLMPLQKKRCHKNKQGWQKVPRVPQDGLHY